MTQNNSAAVINFLVTKNVEIDFPYYLGGEDFDSADDIEELLSDKQAFDAEVIYYSNAIAYLSENDPSLRRSIELASDMGYETSSINSELLATLLKSENIRSDFNDIKDELQNFIDDLPETFEVDGVTYEGNEDDLREEYESDMQGTTDYQDSSIEFEEWIKDHGTVIES